MDGAQAKYVWVSSHPKLCLHKKLVRFLKTFCFFFFFFFHFHSLVEVVFKKLTRSGCSEIELHNTVEVFQVN